MEGNKASPRKDHEALQNYSHFSFAFSLSFFSLSFGIMLHSYQVNSNIYLVFDVPYIKYWAVVFICLGCLLQYVSVSADCIHLILGSLLWE